MFTKEQLADFMQKAEEMQTALKKTTTNMSKLNITGESGAGLVRISMNGNHEVKSVEIDDSLFQKIDKDMIEDLLAAAYNDGHNKIADHHKKSMSNMPFADALNSAGIKLPF